MAVFPTALFLFFLPFLPLSWHSESELGLAFGSAQFPLLFLAVLPLQAMQSPAAFPLS